MKRYDIINSLIKLYNFKSYLEIGVQQTHQCFDRIECESKTGVDPWDGSGATHIMTSDAFFSQNTNKYDIVFIDGLHHAEQVERDIANSLDVAQMVVCHDMLPQTELEQIVPCKTGGVWTGDCYKAWFKYRRRPDLSMCVIDTDCGVGIIQPGSQEPIEIGELNYQHYLSNRHLMNIVSVQEWEKWYNETTKEI